MEKMSMICVMFKYVQKVHNFQGFLEGNSGDISQIIEIKLILWVQKISRHQLRFSW